jgi:hypothetical protein
MHVDLHYIWGLTLIRAMREWKIVGIKGRWETEKVFSYNNPSATEAMVVIPLRKLYASAHRADD